MGAALRRRSEAGSAVVQRRFSRMLYGLPAKYCGTFGHIPTTELKVGQDCDTGMSDSISPSNLSLAATPAVSPRRTSATD
jgi:hypothetical protein